MLRCKRLCRIAAPAVWALLTAISPVLAAETPQPGGDQYSVRMWRIQDGLPQSRISAIAQTQEGYLWIGTSGGLVRFDGSRFVTFDRSNTPAFEEESIQTLLPSRDGSLWIGTDGGGLVRYQKGAFRNYGPKDGLTNTFVRALHQDSRGQVWAGTDRGFFRLENERFVRLDGTGDFPYIAVNSIAEDAQARLWVRGSTSVIVENGKLARLETIGNLPFRSVRLARGRNGLLALSPAGLSRLTDPNSNPTLIQKLPEGLRYTAFTEDSRGTHWIGTANGGLYRVHEGSVSTYRAPDALPDNTVLSLFEDRDNNLWVGTRDGLARFSRRIVSTFASKDGLPDDSVTSLYEDREGTLWMSVSDGRLFRLAGNHLAQVRVEGVSPMFLRTVFQDSKGTHWIGTTGQGVYRLSNGKMTHYTMEQGLRQNGIRAFCEDRNGDIWIGTGSGVNRWDGKKFESYYIEEGLAYGSTRDIKQDPAGDIWIATDRGLSRVHEGKFVHDPVLDKLHGVHINSLQIDGSGAVWLATRSRGLLRLDHGNLTSFTTRDGLPSDTMYNILEDRAGSFWMSTPSGIFSVKRAELEAYAVHKLESFGVLLYGTADGLPTNQMNTGFQTTSTVTRDGHIWFATVKGAVIIDPAQAPIARVPPALIEEMTADNHLIPMHGDVVLPPGYHKLEIHFTAFNLLAPERVNFRYKLEPYDDSWTSTMNRRVAYYTGLPPGRYRFRVIAGDTAAPRNTSEAALSFTWSPHFYQTTWFYSLCGLLAACGVWAVFQFYARQTKARYALLLAERTRLAREMHDTVIQDCVAISTLLEAASSMREADPGRVRELLDRARAQARITLEEARQAVWDLRHPSLGSGVVSTLEEFTRQLAAEKNVAIETEVVGSPVPLNETTDRNLILLAREALRNAVTHGRPNHIRVVLYFEKSRVRIEISDDGCGFRPTVDLLGRRSFGLMGMRERVEQLGGAFHLESSPGAGTRVTANFPLSGRAQRVEQTVA